jgi:NADH dehydrogenase FAD-containing subunit
MLALSTAGPVEYQSIKEDIQSTNPIIDQYLEGKAPGIDIEHKIIHVQLNSLLEGVREGSPPTEDRLYGHLIISVGCKVDNKGVQRVDQELRLKTIDDARIFSNPLENALSML